MAHVTERAGHVNIRVGGNTQETAVLVDSLEDGKMIEKDKLASSNPVRETYKNRQKITKCVFQDVNTYTVHHS